VKNTLLASGIALVLLAGTIAVRTIAFGPPALERLETPTFDVDGRIVAQHVSRALQFRTVSRQDAPHRDPLAFEQFIGWLEATYPTVHTMLARERIADYSLLYEWRGRDPDLKPIFITAHYDVVPVLSGTEADWEHDPFGGTIADGYVWGRGALDDKGPLITILEGVALLLREGFAPDRTVYLCFGHDEERGGYEGAASVTAYLRKKGVRLAWTLDEGSFLVQGMSPGVDVPVALISVAEKGGVSLDLVARAEGGHSSMPPRQTAVGILAEAIVRLENAPLPGGLDDITAAMFGGIARHSSSLTSRMLFANTWLFRRPLEYVLSRRPGGNALMRTTTAATMFSGSEKVNVLPIEATATVNFRLHPRDTEDDVLDHARRVIDDPRVDISMTGIRREASTVSSTEAQGYLDIASVTHQIFNDAAVVPSLTVGGTDSHHYHEVADDSYRYHPMILISEDLTRVHGTNERVSIDNLLRATSFYAQLIKTSAGEPGEVPAAAIR
jgi:carboxypeptidase PM20D1